MSRRGDVAWGRMTGWGIVAGLLPIPVIIGATVVFDVLGGSGESVRTFMIVTGLVVGIGGGAALAFWFGRRVARVAERAEIVHGLGVGIVAAVADLVAVTLLGAEITIPIMVAAAVRPPAGLLGGWTVRGSRSARSTREHSESTS